MELTARRAFVIDLAKVHGEWSDLDDSGLRARYTEAATPDDTRLEIMGMTTPRYDLVLHLVKEGWTLLKTDQKPGRKSRKLWYRWTFQRLAKIGE